MKRDDPPTWKTIVNQIENVKTNLQLLIWINYLVEQRTDWSSVLIIDDF